MGPELLHELDKLDDIFHRAQSTKIYQNLHYETYKVHHKLAQYMEPSLHNPNFLLAKGETKFKQRFIGNFSRALSLNKGESSAERVILFASGYLTVLNNKVQGEEEDVDDDDEESTFAERFSLAFVKWLLKGFEVKDKTIRYRVIHTVCEMAGSLGPMSEEDFSLVHDTIVSRLEDKETNIRCKAVEALSKLHGFERTTETDDSKIWRKLEELLEFDPSAEVRRTVLARLPPITEEARHRILTRARDKDVIVRKALYNDVLKARLYAIGIKGGQIQGPLHPLAMTLEQREQLLQNGLRDRESTVRTATEELIIAWVKALFAPASESEDEIRVPQFADTTLQFISLFDITSGRNLDLAEAALRIALKHDADKFANATFANTPEHEWVNFTIEDCFLARVFYRLHCETKPTHEEENNDDPFALPVLKVAGAVDVLSKRLVRINDLSERAQTEAKIREFVGLLCICDFTGQEEARSIALDATSRMLEYLALPLSLVEGNLQLKRNLQGNDYSFLIQTVKMIEDMRQKFYTQGNESDEHTNQRHDPWRKFESMDVEDQCEANELDTRCLDICILMLTIITPGLQLNKDSTDTMRRIFNDFIVPSLKQAGRGPQFQVKTFHCLALCSLLSWDVAIRYLPLFKQRLTGEGNTEFRVLLCQSLFDIPLCYGKKAFQTRDARDAFLKYVAIGLREERDPQVQAVFCHGVSKLLLHGMVDEDKLGLVKLEMLSNLFKTYISPTTVKNPGLRQLLALFFPQYSSMADYHQADIVKIFDAVFLDAFLDQQHRKEIGDEDEDDAVPLARIAAMFVEWTDPTHLKGPLEANAEAIQLDLAESILKCLMNAKNAREQVKLTTEAKKVLCQSLLRLHLPDKIDDLKISRIKWLLIRLPLHRPLTDTVSKREFAKFDNLISKKYHKELKHFTPDDYEKLEGLNDLREFLDDLIPLNSDDGDGDLKPKVEEDVKPTTRKRIRRSESMDSIRAPSLGPSTPETHPNKKRRSSGASQVKVEEDSDIEIFEPSAEERANYGRRGRSSTTEHDVKYESDSDIEIISHTLAPSRRATSEDRRQPSTPPVKDDSDDEIKIISPKKLKGKPKPRPFNKNASRLPGALRHGPAPTPGPSQHTAPARMKPRRPPSETDVIVISSDSEDSAGPSSPLPVAPKPRPAPKSVHPKGSPANGHGGARGSRLGFDNLPGMKPKATRPRVPNRPAPAPWPTPSHSSFLQGAAGRPMSFGGRVGASTVAGGGREQRRAPAMPVRRIPEPEDEIEESESRVDEDLSRMLSRAGLTGGDTTMEEGTSESRDSIMDDSTRDLNNNDDDDDDDALEVESLLF